MNRPGVNGIRSYCLFWSIREEIYYLHFLSYSTFAKYLGPLIPRLIYY